MQFTPDLDHRMEQVKCVKPDCGIISHFVWTALIISQCTEHVHPKTVVRIQNCMRCGTWHEFMQILGPEGGVITMTLTPEEVAQFRVGLDDNSPF
jgi:hypothetical protein